MRASIHLFDADRTYDDGVFPVQFYSDLIPRIGDDIHYRVERNYKLQDSEPASVSGRVKNIEIEYRRFNENVVVLVSVWLESYVAKPNK